MGVNFKLKLFKVKKRNICLEKDKFSSAIKSEDLYIVHVQEWTLFHLRRLGVSQCKQY